MQVGVTWRILLKHSYAAAMRLFSQITLTTCFHCSTACTSRLSWRNLSTFCLRSRVKSGNVFGSEVVSDVEQSWALLISHRRRRHLSSAADQTQTRTCTTSSRPVTSWESLPSTAANDWTRWTRFDGCVDSADLVHSRLPRTFTCASVDNCASTSTD